MPPNSPKTIVQTTLPEVLVADLATAIFRGDYSPGDRLPPIRQLAKTYGVTSATCQRAIARLEEIGLLSVKQGSGMTVLDPIINAGSSALPYWLESVLDEPEQACVILSDFLQLRREIAVTQLIRVRDLVKQIGTEMLAGVLDQFSSDQDPPDLQATADADFAVTRALLALKPQTAYTTILNMFERLVRVTPDLLEAMFGDPDRIKPNFFEINDILCSKLGDVEARQKLKETISVIDQVTLERFEKILNRKKKS
jgi:DNA-binding FadR family transcriptional regulator